MKHFETFTTNILHLLFIPIGIFLVMAISALSIFAITELLRMLFAGLLTIIVLSF